MRKIRDMISEIMTPTAIEADTASNRLYRRVVVSMAHGVLGAGAMVLLVTVCGLSAYAAGVIIMAAYVGKEIMDGRAGGKIGDSVLDSATTAFGVLLYASPMLPLALLAMAAVIIIFG